MSLLEAELGRGVYERFLFQDVCAGSYTPPRHPEQSEGEGIVHMFQMTEKKPLHLSYTHSLALLLNTSRFCCVTRVRGQSNSRHNWAVSACVHVSVLHLI